MTEAEFQSWLRQSNRRPLVMGVLNVTPDSFSDGGKFAGVEAAARHAREMVEQGAELLDVGGESTRPGSERVEPGEQIRRIVPVIEQIASLGVILSVDTTSSLVARAALDAGCHLVNDISGARDDAGMFGLVVERGVPIILMHMLGQPATMQDSPVYGDVVGEVRAFLNERMDEAEVRGVKRENIFLDPGIGFGKSMAHNLELLRRLGEFAAMGRPLVVGTSRKGFIGTITGEPVPANRLFGTAASVAWSVANGAAIVRVHDVGPMAQVVKMVRAIQSGSGADGTLLTGDAR